MIKIIEIFKVPCNNYTVINNPTKKKYLDTIENNNINDIIGDSDDDEYINIIESSIKLKAKNIEKISSKYNNNR